MGPSNSGYLPNIAIFHFHDYGKRSKTHFIFYLWLVIPIRWGSIRSYVGSRTARLFPNIKMVILPPQKEESLRAFHSGW